VENMSDIQVPMSSIGHDANVLKFVDSKGDDITMNILNKYVSEAVRDNMKPFTHFFFMLLIDHSALD
jgi:hypothetical protein